jgi:hypothetical protein
MRFMVRASDSGDDRESTGPTFAVVGDDWMTFS